MQKSSPLFYLSLRDFSKGLLAATGGAEIAARQASLQAGTFTFNWKNITSVALAGGLSYLGKNFFTPAKPDATV